MAGILVMSVSVLLGANILRREWPPNVYYGGGAVSSYLFHYWPRSRFDGCVFRGSTSEEKKRLALLGLLSLAVALTNCAMFSLAGNRTAGRRMWRLALENPRVYSWSISPSAEQIHFVCPNY